MVPPGHTALTADPVRRLLDRQCAREAEHRRLGGIVLAHAARPLTPYTDERFTMVPRPPRRSAGSAALQQYAVASTLTPKMNSHPSASASASGVETDAGDVDQGVEGAEGGERRVDDPLGLRLAREIGGESADPRARHRLDDARRGGFRGRLVAIDEGYRRALLREEPARGLADAASPAGDEGHPARHASRHVRDQARVSWAPGLTTTRAMAPSTQFAPGGSTTEAERTQKERGFSPRARRALIAQRPGRGHELPAHLDDRGVARAQALVRAVHDGALALLHRLVLHAEAGDAAEHAGAVGLPVHAVVVVAVGRGAHVAVGLGGGRRVVAHVGALALDVERAPRR